MRFVHKKLPKSPIILHILSTAQCLRTEFGVHYRDFDKGKQ